VLELLDPKIIDPFAYEEGYVQKIREYSLLPNKRIGWNYCMDYTWVAMRFQKTIKPGMRVIDIGCGPGAIHGYLEDTHKVDIIGIDMYRWEEDYVDFVGDFTSTRLRRKHGFRSGTVDCIISTSAFEHNNPAKHHKLVNVCLDCLKPGGRLMVTFAATKWQTHYFEASAQWNLSAADILLIYREPVVNFHQYDEIWQRWRAHKYMPDAYRQRYGSWPLEAPPFLSVGAEIVKDLSRNNFGLLFVNKWLKVILGNSNKRS